MNIAAFREQDARLLLELLRFFKQPENPKLNLSLPQGFEGRVPDGWERRENEASSKLRVVANQSKEQRAELNQFYFCSSFRCLLVRGNLPELSQALC